MFIRYQGDLFILGSPQRIDRPWFSTNAFDLPQPRAHTFKSENFIGSINEGGTCNVRILELCSHNLTHIETSDHVIKKGKLVSDLENLNGIMTLVDSTSEGITGTIRQVEISRVPKILGIKTYSSLLPLDYDFTSTKFLALSPDLAKKLAMNGVKILVTDLPSVDDEESKSLDVHKNFFLNGGEAIIELAHFGKAEPGLYFFNCIPALAPYDAFPVGAVIYPLISVQNFDQKR